MDDVRKSLEDLKGDRPVPRLHLSLQQKLELIQILGGPRTVQSILKCKKDYPVGRIPFMFSNLDTQAVTDVLANDMQEALSQYMSSGKN